MEDLILEEGKKVKSKQQTWQQGCDTIKILTGETLTPNALKKRYDRIIHTKERNGQQIAGEYETIYGDGTIEAQHIVNLSPEEKKNSKLVLAKMGYNPNEWELKQITISNWQQHTKLEGTKSLYAVKVRLIPIQKKLEPVDYMYIAKELFKKEIPSLNIKPKVKDTKLNEDKLMEIPSPELHLGKLAWYGDTGQDYDHKIAADRFRKIVQDVIDKQSIEKCDTAYITIGQDFFNSEANAKTTNYTDQQNDLRYKKMFLIGLQLWSEALYELRKHFNKIDVALVQGNHAEYQEFYLFVALQQAFLKDNVVKFSNDYKYTQYYGWGKCAIFSSHGDTNFNRLVKSISNEFYEEWGKAIYRELHLGHLHSEFVVDDESGLIVRRIGSPSGTDNWHHKQRYIGSVQKHQLFIWHKDKGLLDVAYITFDDDSKKKVR